MKKWEKLVKIDDFKPLPQQMRENVKKSTCKGLQARKKMRDLRHTLIHYLLKKSASTWRRYDKRMLDVMWKACPYLLTDLCLAMRTDPFHLSGALAGLRR